MAVYKVPQDVEAEDKLIGPFSFRQFIYLIIVAISIGLLVLLFTRAPAFLGFTMLIILLPVIITFGALALPLRKDQPMETYLLAVVRFYLKPRHRLWDADGSMAMVEITAPKSLEVNRTNGLTQDQAASSLNYLAQLMDTRGWAAKGVVAPAMASQAQMGGIAVSDADISGDVLDENAPVARSFDKLMARSQAESRQAAIERMTQAGQPAPAAPPAPVDPWAALDDNQPADVSYHPYPGNLHQKVIQPLSVQQAQEEERQYKADQERLWREAAERDRVRREAIDAEEHRKAETEKTTTDKGLPFEVSPDTMRLVAESKNLSISTLSNEANRLKKKAEDEGEIVITLR
jgi:hypothetical protein